MSSRNFRVIGLLTLLLLVVFMVCGYAAYLVWQKNRWAQTVLSETAPRHARLMGLDAARTNLESALANAQVLRSQLVYPATQDTNQTGNAAQQRVRDILSASGLQVLSSQVLPPASGKNKEWDRITLAVRTEGDALGLYNALAVLAGQVPVIVINELDVQVQLQRPNAPPRLSMQFSLVVLREPA
jgi:general secretion pathway protein M